MKYLILLLLVSCGGTYKIEAPEEDLVSGKTENTVVVKMEFIDSIYKICADLYLVQDFDSEQLYKQQVAECTLDNLSVLDVNPIDICDQADSPEEIQLCEELGA